MLEWLPSPESVSNILTVLAVCYYMGSNLLYFVLLIAAAYAIRANSRSRPLLEGARRPLAKVAPRISILAPAFNEELSIVHSVRSFLTLNYPSHEVIVINDGSSDATLERLKEAFELEREELIVDHKLSATEVKAVYRSRLHPDLLVIDKLNGGKADALNVGIDFATSELFCAVDADSILEDDALLKVALPFIQDPDATLASGGTVRVVNGCDVLHGRVTKARLPRNILALSQVVEYLRAFLLGRVGWSVFNMTLIISGAFGLFRRDAVIAAGGYREGSIGEDMELIVRLQRSVHKSKRRNAIVFVPDPVCWTEVPSDWNTLRRQRDRWQRGLADTLFANIDIMFNPKFGLIGFIAFPYYFFVELFGPVLEVIATVWLIAAIAFGRTDPTLFALVFAASVIYGILLSMAAVLIDENSFSRYSSAREILLLLCVTVFENFGYRQINTFWRLKGLFNYLRGQKSWGQMQRRGFSKS